MITHRFSSAKADGGDATLVRPSNWNDSHSVDLEYPAPGPGRTNRYYPAGKMGGAAFATATAPTANVLRAYPVVFTRDMLFESIGNWITSSLTGNQRFGLYADDGDLYPGALLYGSDAVGNGTNFRGATGLTVPVTGGDLYWVAFVGSVAPTVVYLSGADMWGLLGMAAAAATYTHSVGWSHAFTFAALPGPFPTSAPTALTGNQPALFIRGA
jgi:hypothetical protein